MLELKRRPIAHLLQIERLLQNSFILRKLAIFMFESPQLFAIRVVLIVSMTLKTQSRQTVKLPIQMSGFTKTETNVMIRAFVNTMA